MTRTRCGGSAVVAAAMAAVLVIGLGACGAGDPGQPGQSAQSGQPGQSGQSGQSGSVAPTPADVVVRMSRSGGFVGTADEVIVHADGSAEISQRGRATFVVELSAAEMSAIQHDLAEANLGSAPAKTRAGGNDYFTYAISADGHAVTIDEPVLPDRMRPLVADLDALLNRTDR